MDSFIEAFHLYQRHQMSTLPHESVTQTRQSDGGWMVNGDPWSTVPHGEVDHAGSYVLAISREHMERQSSLLALRGAVTNTIILKRLSRPEIGLALERCSCLHFDLRIRVKTAMSVSGSLLNNCTL